MHHTLHVTKVAISSAFFASVFVAKYTKTAVGCYTYLTFKPRPISDTPKYTTEDVSVIIPTTYSNPNELEECVHQMKTCMPAKIFIVCPDQHVEACKAALVVSGSTDVTIIGVEKMNKRVQILRALDYVKTDIVVLADDDVFWPSASYLDSLLAIFEDDTVGAGGTRQRVRRDPSPIVWNVWPTIWNFWGIGYLERRVWNNATTNAIDGSISTLSGRTAAYRAEILQTSKFIHYFSTDSWRGRPLNSDDDKCLTRYVYRNGWKIAIQFDPRAVLETTVENGPKYLKQCLRWARAHWRGNCTVMETETYWKEMLWGRYVIYHGSYLTPAFFWEGFMWLSLWAAVGNFSWAKTAYITFGVFIFISKVVKYVPHFLRYPQDMVFIPFAIAFSYFHGFLNMYAYCTMTTTHWGSKTGIDEVSTAEQILRSGWTSNHAVEFAIPGQSTRFSPDGRDYFRLTVPGAAVMSKKEIVVHWKSKAKVGEFAIEDSTDGSANGSTGNTVNGLADVSVAADKLIDDTVNSVHQSAKLVDDSIPKVSTNGAVDGIVKDGVEFDELVDDTVNSVHESTKLVDDSIPKVSTNGAVEGIVKDGVEFDELVDDTVNSVHESTKLVDDSIPKVSTNGAVEGIVKDGDTADTINDLGNEEIDYSATKQACTHGCPILGEIYDGLCPLTRT